jgi:hypothetical protein
MKTGFDVRPSKHACCVVRSDGERRIVVGAVALDTAQRNERVLDLVESGGVDDLRSDSRTDSPACRVGDRSVRGDPHA